MTLQPHRGDRLLLGESLSEARGSAAIVHSTRSGEELNELKRATITAIYLAAGLKMDEIRSQLSICQRDFILDHNISPSLHERWKADKPSGIGYDAVRQHIEVPRWIYAGTNPQRDRLGQDDRARPARLRVKPWQTMLISTMALVKAFHDTSHCCSIKTCTDLAGETCY